MLEPETEDDQTPGGDFPPGSIFNERSSACHSALTQLRTLMVQLGFSVEKRRDNEATLRAYVGTRLTYPLLNPRFVRRRVRGFEASNVLEITVLSKGHEILERRLDLPGFFGPIVTGEWPLRG